MIANFQRAAIQATAQINTGLPLPGSNYYAPTATEPAEEAGLDWRELQGRGRGCGPGNSGKCAANPSGRLIQMCYELLF